MKILLFGKNGQVGWELQKSLATMGGVLAVGRAQADFTDLERLRAFTTKAKPDLIVNAAAFTDVDRAEAEPDLAMTINGEAPGVLAQTAEELGAGFVHYSTDYVFDGEKGEPYTEQDEPHPLNVYGETKLAGERAIEAVGGAFWILRSSWVYSMRGRNFFRSMLRLAREREVISVVDDQVGCPTWSRSLAQATREMIERVLEAGPGSVFECMDAVRGLYHVCSTGQASWYDFARRILDWDPASMEHLVERLVPIPSEAYQAPARRPAYSALDTAKIRGTFGVTMLDWERQLLECWRSAEQEVGLSDSETQDG